MTSLARSEALPTARQTPVTALDSSIAPLADSHSPSRLSGGSFAEGNRDYRFTNLPRLTAIWATTEVKLTCREVRWIDRFALASFDVAALGRRMLNERELPQDKLPRLFPVDRGQQW